jgi:hypothetical protein
MRRALAAIAGVFSDALVELEAGDHRYLTALDRDCYHTVWFELHQPHQPARPDAPAGGSRGTCALTLLAMSQR